MIGIGGYPEGHPLIDSGRLAEALEQKSTRADYITTQLCFDPEAVIDWVANTRELGVTLPVLLGVPGVVDRGALLKISMRIGVGPSRAFLRKQRGLRSFLTHPTATADHVLDALAPRITDPELNVIGFHYYTFNQLVDTWRWERQKQGDLKEAIAR